MGLLDSLVGAAANAAFGGQQNNQAPQGGLGGLDPQMLVGLLGMLMNEPGRRALGHPGQIAAGRAG